MTTPRLSVVLATDTYRTIRPVLAALRRQAHACEIEPVIVLPASARDGVPTEELNAFADARIVVVEAVDVLAAARAAGVRAASAPVVFIGETHTYVQSGWAEALLASFDEAWSAAVPAVINGNPGNAASCAAYLFDYARWGPQRAGGLIADPLVYNTAYRRQALLALGARLATALDPRTEQMWTLLWADGHRAVFVPDARIAHLNVGRVRWLIREKFCSGVALGVRRTARWPRWRRAVYVVASPVIPIVLLARAVHHARHAAMSSLPAGTIPALILCALAKTIGEVVSYIGIKVPSSDAQLTDIELHKARYAGRVES